MSWRSHPMFGAGTALLSGALLAASRDVGPAGPLILIAPVPVLVYALAAPRARHAAAAACIAQMIGTLSLVYAYGAILPQAALAILLVIQSAIFTLVILATRLTACGAPAWVAVLTYPCFAAATEFLFGLVSPHGSFGAVGYALVDILSLLQLASIGGMAALAFVAGLFAMTCAMLVSAPRCWRTIILAGGLPLAASFAFGTIRLQEHYDERTRIALASIDMLTGRALLDDEESRFVAEAYADLARDLAGHEPDIILFPEKVLAHVAAPLEKVARAVETPIVAGFDEVLPDGRRANSARLFEPEGPGKRYIKRKLIPGVEMGYAVGENPLVFASIGVAVCKDMDFAPMIRGYGRKRVQLMLVPAWDFVVDGRLHARMAVVRGVENGFAVARAATEGRLTVSDRYGRIVAEEVTSPEKTVSLVTDLGLRSGGTAYARIGDVVGWLLVAAAALLLAGPARRRSAGPRWTLRASSRLDLGGPLETR